MITIWEILYNGSWRSGYRRILNAKGLSAKEVEKILYQMGVYINRLRLTFAPELERINDLQQFKDKIDEIFTIKWKNYVKDSYIGMYEHFVAYLNIIDTLEAIHGDFFSNKGKERLINGEKIEAEELGRYEVPYIEDDKLKVLMNPFLLYSIKRRMDSKNMSLTEASSFCYSYYMHFLPEMKTKDYSKLLKQIWNYGGRAKSGSKSKRFTITFKDGKQEKLQGVEALKRIIDYFGIKQVFNRKLQVAGHPLLIKKGLYVSPDEDARYEDYDNVFKVFNQSKFKDLYNIINTMNHLFGNKLKVEITN